MNQRARITRREAFPMLAALGVTLTGCGDLLTRSASQGISEDGVVLDVPYVRQRDIPDVGASACASACVVQILAFYQLIREDEMVAKAREIFDRTSSIDKGLLGRDLLVSELERWGFEEVHFDDSGQPELWSLIRDEIDAGRPLILGTRSMTSAGHYLVIRGYSSDTSWRDAKMVCNDPFGVWRRRVDAYDTSHSGQGAEYDFSSVTQKRSDGVFVIKR